MIDVEFDKKSMIESPTTIIEIRVKPLDSKTDFQTRQSIESIKVVKTKKNYIYEMGTCVLIIYKVK